MKTEMVYFLTTLATFSAVLSTDALGNFPADTVPTHQSISWDAIGAAVGSQFEGDALAVSATNDGALLHCVFQRMDGYATTRGLWLVSTTTNSHGESFCLAATGLRRTGERLSAGSGEQNEMSLCPTGKVWVVDSVVRWERPELTEEYSVSVDGVRQDFVIQHRLPGYGDLRLELALSGAQAEAAAYGAKLILERAHRELAYSRLHVTDATGKELHAEIEVLSAGRLAVRVDDTGVVYPVRIDPTFSDANWVSLGTIPGANGAVNAIVEDKKAGVLYFGGSFTAIGSLITPGVAKWNGSTWLPLGSGLGSGVRALALDGSGNLYAGGVFTNAAVTATNIA
jgi:hypothetical protein